MQRTARWCLHVVAVISALVLIALLSLFVMNLIQQRRSRALLEALRNFEIGKTNSVEAVELAREFDFGTELSVWIDEPTSSRIDRKRLKECETAACSIDIVLLLPGQYVGKDWFPRGSEALARYVPQKMVFARLGMKKGIITRVSALLESHDDKPYYEAASVMYSSEGPQDSPRWNIVETSGHFTGGYWGGRYNSLNVRADESVPFDRVHRAFDFNPQCLGLRAHCDPCEILKPACDEHERAK